jgi:hypothetical protein
LNRGNQLFFAHFGHAFSPIKKATLWVAAGSNRYFEKTLGRIALWGFPISAITRDDGDHPISGHTSSPKAAGKTRDSGLCISGGYGNCGLYEGPQTVGLQAF